MDEKAFSNLLLRWYRQHGRALPWRETRDPYKIWLSEIILQQTRVAQGLPYYQSFLEAFPDVQALAKAPLQQVMRLWQGLGYYSRARNLHASARAVVAAGGRFPSTAVGLRELPGIGEYTSAAIASICYDEPVAVVDGNVYRVLSRVFGISTDITAPAGKREFQQRAQSLIPTGNPAAYNQAIMDFGAMQCLPKNPDCDVCPLKQGCYAFQHSQQGLFPVKGRKAAVRTRHFNYIVILQGKKVWMQLRQGKDIWQELYEFLLVETAKPAKPAKCLQQAGIPRLPIMSTSILRHQLTHQTIEATFIIVSLTPGKVLKSLKTTPNSGFYTLSKAGQLPKPILLARWLEQHLFS